MSYLALYRKYRPSTFDEVLGQDIVIKILKKSIINNKISHAYLFSGPRGTGKTTTAKLIAKLINCCALSDGFPCEQCPSCESFNNKNNPDIIEMDAASNNGVDEIRKICDNVNLMPTLSKYKIYIIDEVHMLSTGAFNALLKTLEEPPKHVIFILATTEFYKVPETIVSRCQCFNFERITTENIVNELKYIVEKENIFVDGEVLQLIAKYADGGMRDAINMLDKLYCSSNNITVEDFYNLKGLVSKEDFIYIVNEIFNNNIVNVMERINYVASKGKNLILFAEELLEYIKNIVIKETIDFSGNYNINVLYELINVLCDMIDKMKISSNPKIMLEIGVLKMINLFKIKECSVSLHEKTEEKYTIESKNITIDEKITQTEEIKIENTKNNLLEKNMKIRINNAFATANKMVLEDLKIFWVNFSDYLNNKEFSSVVSYLIDGNLRVAGDGYLIISVKYSSILENALKNIEKVELLFNLVSGKFYKIAFVLEDEWLKLKKRYVDDRNNGIIYQIIEEKTEIDDIIVDESKEKMSKIAEDAISLFGDDLVEIK